MYNPNACPYSIASSVTWNPCPFKMNECPLVREMPLGIDLLKKDNNSLNKKLIMGSCRVDNPIFGVTWVVFMGVPLNLM